MHVTMGGMAICIKDL